MSIQPEHSSLVHEHASAEFCSTLSCFTFCVSVHLNNILCPVVHQHMPFDKNMSVNTAGNTVGDGNRQK